MKGDVTFKTNMSGVRALTLGVNSLGHFSNPLCWALIPETAEGLVTYTVIWHNVQDNVILLLNKYICCNACDACNMFKDLQNSPEVKAFIRSEEFKEGKLKVDATLCNHQGGFHSFTQEEFGFEANTYDNHARGIRASNYTYHNYVLTLENYDKWYDRAVRMSKIGGGTTGTFTENLCSVY